MKNCLFTKLNGVVDNNNLKKFGELLIDINLSGSSPVLAIKDANIELNIKGTGSFYINDSAEALTHYVTSTGTTNISFSAGQYKLSIISKYALTQIQVNNGYLGTAESSELKYITALVNWYAGLYVNGEVDLSHLQNLKVFGIQGSNTRVPNSPVVNYNTASDLTELTSITDRYSDSYGDIVNFGKCVALTTIKVEGTVNITGSIESMANAMIANGRTSGTLSINCLNTGVTYQGAAIATAQIVFSSGSYQVTAS